MSRLFVQTCLVMALLSVSRAAAEEAALVAPAVLPGGGVANPAGTVGYFTNPAGGIDAVNLTDGKLLWESKEANQPLLATEQRLYARAPVSGSASQLRVLSFDTQGKRVLESKPVALPGWVSVGPMRGRSFAATARLDGENLLFVWESRGWYALGRAPTRQEERAAQKHAVGMARVDAQSGKVEILEADKGPKGLPRIRPAEVRMATVGERVLSFTDSPLMDPRRPDQNKRTLRVADAAGKLLWEREIAAPVYFPPLK